MKLQNVEPEQAIYGTLFSLSNRIQTIGDKEFKDITLKQQFLLIGLGMFTQPPTLKEMGELIGCSYQNVKRMANHLEKEGYLKLIQDEEDKRKILLVPTDKIGKTAKESEEASIQFMHRLYKNISREDMEITLKTLMAMDKNLGGVIE
jgi:DNA-binding MarR family transcriptional regulator